MNSSRSFAKLLAYLFFLGLSLLVFVGGGFGGDFLRPSVESGKLGLPSAEVISKVFEIVLSVVTALVTSGVFGKSKWMTLLIETIGPLFNKPAPEVTVENKFEQDMMRMIQHAISQRKRDLVVLLIDELASEPFMAASPKPVFPTPNKPIETKE